MDPRALRVLEYDKIISRLCLEAQSRMTREALTKLVPSSDPLKVANALSQTDEAMTVLLKKGTPPLGNFYDVSGLAHLAAKEGSLTMKQLLEVAYNLAAASRTKQYLSGDLPELPYIDGLASAISVKKDLEDEIVRCILSEDEMADSASPELRRLRRAILRKNEEIRVKIQQIVGSAENRSFLQDAIVTQRQGRYCIPVKAEHKARVGGIVHDQSASGQTLFIEPQAIVNMNNELTELELAEKKEVQRIIDELSGRVGLEELAIKGNQEILFKLDIIFAKARLAADMNAAKPVMNADGVIDIKKGRHPLIDKKKVVPINIALGEDYQTLVITGPNTGGKTVTLKTVGLLCLMAQAGLFVPASDGTRLSVFKEIYADIGDEQSIEQSLSTFSSHMTNIVGIVNGAKSGCLVLLDELGAGTDPTEGAALAISVLDHLRGRGAQTLATTHYTELKKYAISTEGVQNASMEFDVETLSPTYRLTIGVPGKSNAFEISQKLGLDGRIIDHARDFLERGDIAFEDVLTNIEADRKKAEDDLAEAEELRAAMQKQKERMDSLEARLEERREKIMQDARDEAKELLDEARAEIDLLRKNIDEAQASGEFNRSVEEARRRLAEKRKDYVAKPVVEENREQPQIKDIKPGIRVNVLSAGQKATVLTAPDEKGNFRVQAGIIKLDVNISGVTLVKENVTDKEREKIKNSRIRATFTKTVPMSVNVVGKNLDDALMEVDKYLDDAFLGGLGEVSVIHGRGAGILREGIQKMLKRHKHVESFRKGGPGEGGDGVTIVTIKR